ncbi:MULTISPECIES: glycosyl hydrolase 53 family protein [unclassified Rhizobium]|uniref:glycosyl hydrolase 53 family protein n=1 Tax=unclassified Rhizobium TaxID=2613769 RepID=UPI001ADB443A|nr:MULTISPECIES: glycosyl hydrolase 53 family protein [unclassified Rhizobium]MBO9099496.1 glycosyl hydrolase 53 family protein [Rhizobium sp. L58/93]QXZ87022.1 glycosyl hydrolase 53 family protein [Rhizobium sp. K1/93]QXZ92944.1 glycosyl hydrolase 53 family protein [Rhizobium sp. K15/93]
MKIFILLTSFIVGATLLAPATSQAKSKMTWGVNGPSVLENNRDYLKAFAVMKQRGLTTYRINLNLTATTPDAGNNLAEMISGAKKYNIKLKPILFTAFQWEDSLGKSEGMPTRRKAIYDDAYARTYEVVKRFRADITDWEMGNEIDLKTRFDNGNKDIGPPESWKAQTFNTPRMLDWASLLRGQSDAIVAVNKEFGTHLRSVLNVAQLQFGFLNFMIDQRVAFDVISYHYYEKLGTDMTAHWNGSEEKVNLFKVLASFHRPIIINETNCGEIYDRDYQNVPGGNLNTECLRSFNNILSAIANQTEADIEGVEAYTLIDLPQQTSPIERRFGLMYDLDHPKLSLAILAQYAGGLVTHDESRELAKLAIH